MKNFRKIEKKDLIKLRVYWKSFDNYFIDEKEDTYIINYKNISYILVQQKNKKDLLIELYEFRYLDKEWNNIYGTINVKIYNSTTQLEKLFRKCKRIIFCHRKYCNVQI